MQEISAYNPTLRQTTQAELQRLLESLGLDRGMARRYSYNIAGGQGSDLAGKLGLESVPAQARMWNVLGPQTGVDSPLGAPKLELLSRRIMQASQETGIPPEVLRDQVLTGRNYSSYAPFGVGLGAGAGGLLMDEEQFAQ